MSNHGFPTDLHEKSVEVAYSPVVVGRHLILAGTVKLSWKLAQKSTI